MLGSAFFAGFRKAAEVLTDYEDRSTPQDEQASQPLPHSVSKAGPRLDTATEESDRGKHETFKG